MGYLKNSLIGVVHTLSIEVAIFRWICSSAALAWGGAACVLSHAVAFSVPSPLLGQTLYKGFDWIVILDKCGYGNLPFTPICDLFNFCPVNIAWARQQFFQWGVVLIIYMRGKGIKKVSIAELSSWEKKLKLRNTGGCLIHFRPAFSCNPGSKLSPVARATLPSIDFFHRIVLRRLFDRWVR